MRKPGLVAFVLQNSGDQLADVGLIVNDQNVSSHVLTPTSGGCSELRSQESARNKA